MPNILMGTVTRYFPDKGYGWVKAETGKTYFIHISRVPGETELLAGQDLNFIPERNDRGDYCTNVVLIGPKSFREEIIQKGV